MAATAKKKSIDIDPTHPLEITVTCTTVQVVAYRIWHMPAGSNTWTRICDGHTADDTTDSCHLSRIGAGDKVHYWLGVGGRASSSYRALVDFLQNGQLVPDGSCEEKGTTDADGTAVRNTEVTLK